LTTCAPAATGSCSASNLATYDIRTTLDEPITRRIFMLYWRTVSPFVKAIMRATLRTAAKQARS
jgi:hypothetical protein